jgi:hypothetical protein
MSLCRVKLTSSCIKRSFPMRLFSPIAILAFIIGSNYSQAGIYVDKIDHPRKVVVLKIEGRIKYEDNLEFQKVFDEIKRDGYRIKLNSVVLNTAGGSPSAAIAIGKIIRKEKLNTFVGPKHHCGSACIYILSSGIIRMAYGEVTVHRTTYEDGFPTEKLENSLKQTDVDNANHLFEMGMATQLVDAIRITPNYTNWKLDDKEKRRWGVHGTERLHEELWFRTTAKAKFYDTDVVRDFFYKFNDKCTKMAKEFKMTVFECVKAEI